MAQPSRTRSPSSEAIAFARASLPSARRAEASAVPAARCSALESQVADTRSSPTVYVPSSRLQQSTAGERLERGARERLGRGGGGGVRAERIDGRRELTLGLEQQRGQRPPAGSHLASGERESLWHERQVVLGRAAANVVVAGLDELAAALEARAVGHDTGPDPAADAMRASNTVTSTPARARSTAQARPARPAPTTATRMA